MPSGWGTAILAVGTTGILPVDLTGRQDACPPHRLVLGLARKFHRRAMLIAFIQGIIGPLDKHFSPFNQAGGEESHKHAEDDFLRKSGVHPIFRSTPDATKSAATLKEIDPNLM